MATPTPDELWATYKCEVCTTKPLLTFCVSGYGPTGAGVTIRPAKVGESPDFHACPTCGNLKRRVQLPLPVT